VNYFHPRPRGLLMALVNIHFAGGGRGVGLGDWSGDIKPAFG
jgi:hypothetical protein